MSALISPTFLPGMPGGAHAAARMLLATLAAAVAKPETPHELCDERFFFHQMLSGVDIARDARSPKQQRVFGMAKQMQNFMYLVGDAQTQAS